MGKTKGGKGYSLAEILIVVAIIIVLGAVATVAVFVYLRSMTKLEYDAYAKEIFIAAQNHLAMSESQGYLGRTDFGAPEDPDEQNPDISKNGVYYFVKADGITGVDGLANVGDESSALELMLPFAAVDETVRLGGCYIIRYHKDSAQVLDVFFWKSTGRFSHIYVNSDYGSLMNNRSEKNVLMNYSGEKSVIGWYGGTEAQNLPHGKILEPPTVRVVNDDVLRVYVRDPNRSKNSSKDNPKALLKLIITGVTSKNVREITLSSDHPDLTYNAQEEYEFNIVLDSVKTEGKHFYNLFCESGKNGTNSDNALIPGEDIVICAVSYNNSELTNVAYSAKHTTNSLFAYNASDKENAHIANIRHLENLDNDLSGFAYNNKDLPGVSEGAKVFAVQDIDLSWKGFNDSGSIVDMHGYDVTSVGKYYPVSPEYILNYDGGSHAVADVEAMTSGDGKHAGLFGKVVSGTIKNLKLVDFNITASGSGNSAGALAGNIEHSEIINVLAVSTDPGGSAVEIKATGSGNAGGLVGTAANSLIVKSAAALRVKSTGGDAGGLVGNADCVDVEGCYSGGHTENGAYDPANADVEAYGKAGGLIGSLKNTLTQSCTVRNSYSTCSVKGSIAGGFAGEITGSSAVALLNDYAAGLVTGSANEGAFNGIVTGNVSFTGCKYYETVNERPASDGVFTYLEATGSGADTIIIGKIDENAASYNTFSGADTTWNSAHAYDSALSRYYHGKYNLRTVEQLGESFSSGEANFFVKVHYGDWPSPEVKFINEE